MTSRLIDAGWSHELTNALGKDCRSLRIVCPFIKVGALERLLHLRPATIKVITRFNLGDFAVGVSDIDALRSLLAAGASVRGIRNLHAKLYIFGTARAIITSANLTQAALDRNQEFGLISDDTSVLTECERYFHALWDMASADLTVSQVNTWENEILRLLATGVRPGRPMGLGDYGADAKIAEAPPPIPLSTVEAPHALVKFLGEGNNRVSLSFSILDEIKEAGCHWAVAYPASKRPRRVRDGDVIFISRMTRGPNDFRIFGRAIGMRYVSGRDDASEQDIMQRPWKENWPRYIRVHHAEFIAGVMANGISLNKLMDELRADAFELTQKHASTGEGDTNPRHAYNQRPDVMLSPQGLAWLNERFEAAFAAHGKVALDDLEKLDWPQMPEG